MTQWPLISVILRYSIPKLSSADHWFIFSQTEVESILGEKNLEDSADKFMGWKAINVAGFTLGELICKALFLETLAFPGIRY